MSVSQDQGLPSQGQTQTSVQSSGQQRCGWPSWPPPPSPPTAPTPRSSPHSIPVTVLCRLESGSGRGGAWALPPQAPGLPTPRLRAPVQGTCPRSERQPLPSARVARGPVAPIPAFSGWSGLLRGRDFRPDSGPSPLCFSSLAPKAGSRRSCSLWGGRHVVRRHLPAVLA